MFGLRSARGRVFLTSVLLLLLLASVTGLAIWRAHTDQEALHSLAKRADVVHALDDARAQSSRSAAVIAAAVFAEDPAPYIESWRQTSTKADEGLEKARSGLIALEDTQGVAALDSLAEQSEGTTEQVDALVEFAGTADLPTRIALGQQYLPDLWGEADAWMTGLGELATEQQTELAAERAAADSAVATTMTLLVGFSAFAFVVASAALVILMASVVRPLLALRRSARAVALGNLEMDTGMAGPEEVASLIRDFNEMVIRRGKAEDALRLRAHELDKRVRELDCLYAISHLAEEDRLSPDGLPQGIVALIPPSSQYPEVACARITLEGREFRTENCGETASKLTSDIVVNGEPIGTVEVGYLEERPESDEGPFLKEERDLIDAVAERVGRIIERQRTEEALRESDARYRRVFEHVRDVFYQTDARGIITDISPSVERFGYTRERLIGTQVLEVYENPDQRTALLRAIMEREDIADYEIRLKTGDGRVADVSVTAHVIRGPDGALAGVEGILRDISERKRGEEAQRHRGTDLRRAS